MAEAITDTRITARRLTTMRMNTAMIMVTHPAMPMEYRLKASAFEWASP